MRNFFYWFVNITVGSFLSGEIILGMRGWLASRDIHLPKMVNNILSTLFGGHWWAWAITLIVVLIMINHKIFVKISKRLLFGILNIDDKIPQDLITLEEAVSIFYENHKLPDELLQYIPPLERQDVLTELFNERDNPKKPDEEPHWKNRDILNLLTIFFKEGSLTLYGSSPPARNIEKIPLQDIKSFAKDFNCIYYPGTKSVKYKDLRCSQKELLKFINKEKRPGGLLFLDSLKKRIISSESYKFQTETLPEIMQSK